MEPHLELEAAAEIGLDPTLEQPARFARATAQMATILDSSGEAREQS